VHLALILIQSNELDLFKVVKVLQKLGYDCIMSSEVDPDEFKELMEALGDKIANATRLDSETMDFKMKTIFIRCMVKVRVLALDAG
jgi:hypothetical protein